MIGTHKVPVIYGDVTSTFTMTTRIAPQWAPAAISGGATASFVYDADGNRVKSTIGGVTTVYIAGVFEFIENGATDKITKYYEGNAMRRSGYGVDDGVFYLLQDHLNSSSVMVDQAGNTVATNYYYPYGGNRGGTAFSGLSTKRFTGQYHESNLPGGQGLSYYNARWYDAQLGRFLSADTIVPGPHNPQAFNRYSYVLNNPLSYTDPTGHCIFGIDTLVCAVVAVIGAGAVGYGVGRVVYEAGMQHFPATEQIRRDQIGGALVTNLSEVIAAQSQAHSINPLLVSAVIRHESAAIERRIFTLLPSTIPGAVADSTEYVQSLLQGNVASIGIAQMQIRRAQELEELGYVSPAANEYDRRQALLDPTRAVGYVAGMLHYLSDHLQTMPGYSSLSQEEQARLVLIGYNEGWEVLQYNIEYFGFDYSKLLQRRNYDDQTLNEYTRWVESQ